MADIKVFGMQQVFTFMHLFVGGFAYMCFLEDNDISGKTIQYEQSFAETDVISPAVCSYRCSLQVDCTGFFYWNTTGLCQGSTSVNRNTLTSTETDSVYFEKPAGPYRRLGCYRDNGTTVLLPVGNCYPTGMSVDLCFQICKQPGYFNYFGLEAGICCYCSRDGKGHDTLGEADNCDMACSSNLTTTCGGNWAMEIFQINC